VNDVERARVDQLHPDARAALMSWLAECETKGYRISIGQTVRTRSEQLDLWKEGTKTASPVSWHELKRAWHFYLLDSFGKRVVDGKRIKDAWMPHYLWCAREAEKVGCRQLGFRSDGKPRYIGKSKFWDPFHLEFRGPFETLAEACRAEAPNLVALLG
jgi:hypothetical protein